MAEIHLSSLKLKMAECNGTHEKLGYICRFSPGRWRRVDQGRLIHSTGHSIDSRLSFENFLEVHHDRLKGDRGNE